MSSVSYPQPISVHDYLRGELDGTVRHEFIDGVVYAKAGAKNSHNRIATNVTVSLGGQLRGKRCEVFNSDTKVRIRQARSTRFYYPDAMVVCRPNPPDDTFQDAPSVIVEVLSESTRRTDEYEKREAYLTIDSLDVYLLIEPDTSAVVVYRRGESGFDREVVLGIDGTIPHPTVECELTLAEVYENVTFPAHSPNDENPHS